MESMLTGLANFGIGGLMAGAFIYVHWHLVHSVIPSMLNAFRQEQRELREQHDKHINALVARLDILEDHVRDIKGHMGNRDRYTGG